MHIEYLIYAVLGAVALLSLVIVLRVSLSAARRERELRGQAAVLARSPRRRIEARRQQAERDAAGLSGQALADAVNASRTKAKGHKPLVWAATGIGILAAALLLSAAPVRADDAPLAIHGEGQGVRSGCVDAVYLQLGQPAPCTGILMPEGDARDLVMYRDMEPEYLSTIEDLTERLTLCLSAPAPVAIVETTPWWKSPVFWGVAGLFVGAGAVGGFSIWLAVR